MTKDQLGQTVGYFIKEVCRPDIFIMTEDGNYIFSDPQYRGGTNKVIKVDMTAFEWMKDKQTYSMGGYIISDYCGDFIYND